MAKAAIQPAKTQAPANSIFFKGDVIAPDYKA